MDCVRITLSAGETRKDRRKGNRKETRKGWNCLTALFTVPWKPHSNFPHIGLFTKAIKKVGEKCTLYHKRVWLCQASREDLCTLKTESRGIVRDNKAVDYPQKGDLKQGRTCVVWARYGEIVGSRQYAVSVRLPCRNKAILYGITMPSCRNHVRMIQCHGTCHVMVWRTDTQARYIAMKSTMSRHAKKNPKGIGGRGRWQWTAPPLMCILTGYKSHWACCVTMCCTAGHNRISVWIYRYLVMPCWA